MYLIPEIVFGVLILVGTIVSTIFRDCLLVVVILTVVDSIVDIMPPSADSGVENMVVVASNDIRVVADEVVDSLDTTKIENVITQQCHNRLSDRHLLRVVGITVVGATSLNIISARWNQLMGRALDPPKVNSMKQIWVDIVGC